MVANEARKLIAIRLNAKVFSHQRPLLKRLEPVGLFRATRTVWRENSNLNHMADFATVQRVVKDLNTEPDADDTDRISALLYQNFLDRFEDWREISILGLGRSKFFLCSRSSGLYRSSKSISAHFRSCSNHPSLISFCKGASSL
jgi:hypothetical protein